MNAAMIDFSEVSPLPLLLSENVSVRDIVTGLNRSLRAFDLGGCIEKPFELPRPTQGFPNTDYARQPWQGLGRHVVIVEADGSDPGMFWVNLSRYSMPPELDEHSGYFRRLVHLATAKVYGDLNAWIVAANASRLLNL